MTDARCEFVPPHEPWTCRVHQGTRTSLDEPQCDAIRPAKPLTPGQLDNLRRADAEGRVPHNRYLVRGLLATLEAVDREEDWFGERLGVPDPRTETPDLRAVLPRYAATPCIHCHDKHVWLRRGECHCRCHEGERP